MALLTHFHMTVLFGSSILPGVTLNVYEAGTLTHAALFVDNTGVTPQANPFVNHPTFGTVDFFVGVGRYDLVFTKLGYTFPPLNDISIGVEGLQEETATATLTSSAGVAALIAAALVPVGVRILKVTTEVTTSFGTSGGLTGFAVGDSVQADRWGTSTGLTAGATTDYAQYTDATMPVTAAPTDIRITPLGGDFDSTGALDVTVHYLP